MADIALLLLSSIFNMAVCTALVLWDRKRLPQTQRDRSWNTASFGAAVFSFSPWCVVAHFWVTRRSLWGIVLGLLWLLLVLLTIVAFNGAAMWLFGIAPD